MNRVMNTFDARSTGCGTAACAADNTARLRPAEAGHEGDGHAFFLVGVTVALILSLAFYAFVIAGVWWVL